MNSIFLQIYYYHPLKLDYCYDKYDSYGYTTDAMLASANTTEWQEVTVLETVFETVTSMIADVSMGTTVAMMPENITDIAQKKKCTSTPKPLKYQPNTALLSTILMFGTFCLAWFFKMLKGSKFLGRKVSMK